MVSVRLSKRVRYVRRAVGWPNRATEAAAGVTREKSVTGPGCDLLLSNGRNDTIISTRTIEFIPYQSDNVSRSAAQDSRHEPDPVGIRSGDPNCLSPIR